ncbi:hypothetical protein D7Y24_06590 [Stenotrophomonas maltophilia]|nr:hypothetical protein [Stenotrophomonas maltophilia]
MRRRRRTCWTWWSSRPSRRSKTTEGRPRGRPSSWWVGPAAGRLPLFMVARRYRSKAGQRPALPIVPLSPAPGSTCRCHAVRLRPARGRAWRDMRRRR